MDRIVKTPALAAALAAAMACWGAPASIAQEGGGVLATFRINPTLRIEGDGDVQFDTGLTFGIESATRVETISFDITSRFRANDSGTDLRDPVLRFDYARANRSSRVTFGASAQRTDISTEFAVISDDFSDVDLVVDTGTRTNATLNFGLELGRDAPLGVSFSLNQSLRLFSGTSDPDLFDTTTTRASLTTLFRIDPRLTARATYSQSDFDTDGAGTDRTRRGLSVGADFAATPRLDVSGSLSYNETEFSTGRREDGLGASVSATLALPNGTVSGSLSNQVGENGRRTSFNIARTFETRSNDVTLRYGLTRTPDGDPNQVFAINFGRELTSRTAINLSAQQDIAVNSDADDILRLRTSASVTHALSDISRLSAGLTLFSVDNIDDGTDSRRVSANVGYSRQLTPDWDLNARLTMQRNTEGDDSSDSQALSVGVSRAFAWRP